MEKGVKKGKNDIYIRINKTTKPPEILDMIRENAREMLKKYGEVDPNNLINDDLANASLFTMYDQDNNVIDMKSNSAIQDNEYWENSTDEYIEELKKRLNEDLTGITQEDLTKLIVYNNRQFLNFYMYQLKKNALDLADEGIKFNYAGKLTSALVDIQLVEIQKIGVLKFLSTNIKSLPKDFIAYVDLDSLKDLQGLIKDELSEYKEYIKKEKPSKDYTPKSDEEIATKYLSNDLGQILFFKQLDRVEKMYQKDKEFYDTRHKKREIINQLLKDIADKYQKIQDEIEKQQSTSNEKQELITREYSTNIDTQPSIKRAKTKLPKTITIDYDILKLFSNIYPNYRYMSIDEDRHKDIDIKAMFMLDLDLSDDMDTVREMENMRLIDFIRSGKIAVYPVQSALINGFISLRDEQDSMDKVIPLLSTLQYITENKKLRLTKSKKDLMLYEDYMLFFKRCKIQIKITNRKTKEVLFEIMNPIPLLENTPAYKEGTYGYIVGNSIINILKNEFDSLRDKRYMTTTQTNKGYLNTKLPTTPSTINLTQYIFSKITQMINAYKSKGKYNGVINIELLYDYQAQYNKHYKPNKSDKDNVRTMLNKYLDELIKKGLIDSYEPIKKAKEINQYKITLKKENDEYNM